MPLWIGAYLADTMKLTTLQHGAYFLLLMAYWRERAALKDCDDELRAITKTEKSEWKKLRPVLEKFFVLRDGVWWHKRVEVEMAKANGHKDAATSKAKAAAEARWNKKKTDAPSMPQALPEDMLDECPPPTPTHIGIGIPTLVAKEVKELNTHNGVRVSNPAQICMAMKRKGIGDVAPSNQDLLMLIEAGATVDEFEAAAASAVEKSKGFKYALGIVKNARIAAKTTASSVHHGPMPQAAQPTETAYQRSMRLRVAEFSPEIARQDPALRQTITLEAENVTAITRN